MPLLPDVGAAAGAPGRGRARVLGARVPLVSTLVLVVLPKCPLCAAAYLGVLGSFSGACLRVAWGAPLTGALLAAALAGPALRAWRRRGAVPLVVALLGALALVIGKLTEGGAPLVGAGALVLAGAALWSARAPRGAAAVPACSKAGVPR